MPLDRFILSETKQFISCSCEAFLATVLGNSVLLIPHSLLALNKIIPPPFFLSFPPQGQHSEQFPFVLPLTVLPAQQFQRAEPPAGSHLFCAQLAPCGPLSSFLLAAVAILHVPCAVTSIADRFLKLNQLILRFLEV